MRLVLDTSVLVAALRSRGGASNHLLDLVADRRVTALATSAVYLEYEAVLTRREQLVAMKLKAEVVRSFLSGMAAVLEPVEVHFTWRPQLPDPADEFILDAAVNGRADAIVTFNRRDFEGPAPRFRIEVLTPAETVRRVLS